MTTDKKPMPPTIVIDDPGVPREAAAALDACARRETERAARANEIETRLAAEWLEAAEGRRNIEAAREAAEWEAAREHAETEGGAE